MFFLCCRKVVEELETKCLKATNHLANDQLTYETPSDYDPLSVNMGQMIVYRFTIRYVATYLTEGSFEKHIFKGTIQLIPPF
jgi:hypothetical protein